MVDYDAIGKRIREGRKYILKISQERMAEELQMYQADISNLERAKSGSGIADLSKLDQIADYLQMPLEALIFGRGSSILSYTGKDTLKPMPGGKLTVRQRTCLKCLTGCEEKQVINSMCFAAGQYTVATMVENQLRNPRRDENGSVQSEFMVQKLHSFIFWKDEIIGVMVADYTTVMMHIHQPSLAMLQSFILPNVLDVTDVIRTLNPYWALWRFSEDKETQQDYFEKMLHRMDELRAIDENRPVLYIESVYVREDCRGHGLFHMYTDMLKLLCDGAILWLNMEPTSGNELSNEYGFYPEYEVSELGQLSINAAIAQKCGYTPDEDLWHLKAKSTDARGNVIVETVLAHKCAYYMPQEIRELLRDDGDLVAKGRRMQKEQYYREQDEKQDTFGLDSSYGRIQGNLYAEIKKTENDEETLFFTEILMENGTTRFAVSRGSLLRGETPDILEEYISLDDAEDSEYIDFLVEAEELMDELLEEDGEF